MAKKKTGDTHTAWKFSDALKLIEEIRPRLETSGWYVGMTGSVLFQGRSDNDLDLIVYPANGYRFNLSQLHRALHLLGWSTKFTVAQVQKAWYKQNKYASVAEPIDNKHVEVWNDNKGRRVDLFILR